VPIEAVALQHNSICPYRGPRPRSRALSIVTIRQPKPREVFIQGVTHDGRTFRPSDWSERLAGVMSCFRPAGVVGGRPIGYSPYCVPNVINGVKCVVVNETLREIEPMAWDFVMNFARDNDLQVVEACLLPEPEPEAESAPEARPTRAAAPEANKPTPEAQASREARQDAADQRVAETAWSRPGH
jgi:hypothetical protein